MDAIFLDIQTIPGDSDIAGYEKQIEVLSFNHGVSIPVTGDVSNENRTSGRPVHQDIMLTKFVDKASPILHQKCCEGANIGQVTVTIGRNDEGVILPFLIYIIKDAVISTASIGGGGGGKPVENISLNYTHIEWKYTSQKQEGGKEGEVVGSWSLAKNKAE